MNNGYNSKIHHPNADTVEYASGAKLSYDISRALLVSGEAVILAPFACTVVQVEESHRVKSTAVGTLDILNGVTALLGATKIDLEGAINTVQSPAVSGVAVAAGDILKLTVTGTPVALANVRVVITLQMS